MYQPRRSGIAAVVYHLYQGRGNGILLATRHRTEITYHNMTDRYTFMTSLVIIELRMTDVLVRETRFM